MGQTSRSWKRRPVLPVIATLVAEVYGKIGQPYEELVQAAAESQTPHGGHSRGGGCGRCAGGSREKKLIFRVDRAKAMMHGISDRQIAETLQGTHGWRGSRGASGWTTR